MNRILHVGEWVIKGDYITKQKSENLKDWYQAHSGKHPGFVLEKLDHTGLPVISVQDVRGNVSLLPNRCPKSITKDF